MNTHDDEPEAPEMPLAFDDSGRPVPVAHPVYEVTEAEVEGFSANLTDDLFDFALIAMNADGVNERVNIAAYLRQTPRAAKSYRELGIRLGCSHVAARRRVTKFKAQLRSELKNYTPKA